MDTNKIKEIISRYQFGKENLLQHNLKIICNPYDGDILLDPFFFYKPPTKIGICPELRHTAYLEISQEFPNISVTPVLGRDNQSFVGRRDGHWYLLLSENNLMNGKSEIESSEEISSVIEQDPLLVDPCFRLITKFSGSGYKIEKLYNKEEDIKQETPLLLKKGKAIPLAISDKNEIIYLTGSFEFPQYVSFLYQKSDKDKHTMIPCDLEDPTLDGVLQGNDEIINLINHIRKTPIEYTDKPIQKPK